MTLKWPLRRRFQYPRCLKYQSRRKTDCGFLRTEEIEYQFDWVDRCEEGSHLLPFHEVRKSLVEPWLERREVRSGNHFKDGRNMLFIEYPDDVITLILDGCESFVRGVLLLHAKGHEDTRLR